MLFGLKRSEICWNLLSWRNFCFKIKFEKFSPWGTFRGLRKFSENYFFCFLFWGLKWSEICSKLLPWKNVCKKSNLTLRGLLKFSEKIIFYNLVFGLKWSELCWNPVTLLTKFCEKIKFEKFTTRRQMQKISKFKFFVFSLKFSKIW